VVLGKPCSPPCLRVYNGKPILEVPAPVTENWKTPKAIETGIILLIDQVGAVVFVKFQMYLNSLNLSTNLNCCLVQHNGSFCFIKDR
jgi:hypothetical protein